MPHIILEYSRSAGIKGEVTPFFLELHNALAATGIVESARLKGRAIEHEHTIVGTSIAVGYVFLQIAILDGRTLEERKRLSEIAAEVMKKWVAIWKVNSDCSITIEMREMERATHQKIIAKDSGA